MQGTSQHLARRIHEKPRVSAFFIDSFVYKIHSVAVFAIDLDGVNSQLHLAHRTVELMDHAGVFVDALDRASHLQPAGSHD